MDVAYYVEYHEPGRGWIRVAEWDDSCFPEACAQFELTCANVSAATAVRLVAPAES